MVAKPVEWQMAALFLISSRAESIEEKLKHFSDSRSAAMNEAFSSQSTGDTTERALKIGATVSLRTEGESVSHHERGSRTDEERRRR